MALKLEHITYIYDAGTSMAHKALDDVSLDIPDNSFIGLIGHTGSGKSTLVTHLNGLIAPTTGRVLWNGEDIHSPGFDKKMLRSRVGLVFQYPEHQLFETDVFSDVCFGPKNLKLPPEEIEKRAYEALKAVGMPDKYYRQSPFDLSGGQKRRAAIAGVLAMEPQILVLDEPTAGLDPRGRDEILHLLTDLHQQRQITVVLVSHSMEDVARVTERLIVMHHGQVQYDAPPVEVFRHYSELEKMGLSAPGVTYLMQKLAAKNFKVRTDITTIGAAADEIIKALKKEETDKC